MPIKYRKGYKYQLVEDFEVATGIKPIYAYESKFLKIDADGKLLIKAGYAWDGASGPARDTLNFMTPSLVHDALYQLMNERIIHPDEGKKPADELLVTLAEERKMSGVRRWWVLNGVKLGGHPEHAPKPILTAP